MVCSHKADLNLSHLYSLGSFLGSFVEVHFGDIVEGVGLSAWLRPLFVVSRVCFELELHSRCPAPLYLFFESELYHDDFDNQ